MYLVLSESPLSLEKTEEEQKKKWFPLFSQQQNRGQVMRNGTLTQKSSIELDETKNAIKLAEKTEEEPKKKRFPLFSQQRNKGQVMRNDT